MTDTLKTLGDVQLLTLTRALAGKSCDCEADLLLHLGEVDARKLYLEEARSNLFVWCVERLNFSEDVAYNRIAVARVARRFPVVIEYLRSGRIHLTGLKILAPYLTEENCTRLLEAAVHKSKVRIEELRAQENPKPLVPDSIRQLPRRSASPVSTPAVTSPPMDAPSTSVPAPSSSSSAPMDGPVPPVSITPAPKPIQPLAEDAFRIQFTASRRLRDKLKKLQALMSHTNGDLATLFEKAVDLLTEKVEKQRFGAETSRPRSKPTTTQEAQDTPPTRHIPTAIKRQVWERDGNQCTFRSAQGERCPETELLQLDHLDGWARTRQHSVERIVLKCRAHNLHAAEAMYGAEWMNRVTQRVPFQGGETGSVPHAAQVGNGSPPPLAQGE